MTLQLVQINVLVLKKRNCSNLKFSKCLSAVLTIHAMFELGWCSTRVKMHFYAWK